jgi:hypothetical protein
MDGAAGLLSARRSCGGTKSRLWQPAADSPEREVPQGFGSSPALGGLALGLFGVYDASGLFGEVTESRHLLGLLGSVWGPVLRARRRLGL